MKREKIRIRDPFILLHEGKYYMYGTGTPNAEDINHGRQFWCYISEDLEEWSQPIICFDAPEDFWGEKNFWAPEVHLYNGKFYMLATFYSESKGRAVQALRADAPEGPYSVFGEPLTPAGWMCLDGTLYIEDEKPYLVFCHEWLQVADGEIVYVPLKEDISAAIGEPTVLFSASESGWATNVSQGMDEMAYVTDGPWLMNEDGVLTMFWSSFRNGSYAVGSATSSSGKLIGPWEHNDNLLFEKDGGHGMMFETKDKEKMFVLHQPNKPPLERARFFGVERKCNKYRFKNANKTNQILY